MEWTCSLASLAPFCHMFVSLLKSQVVNHHSRVTEFLGHEIVVAALTHAPTGEKWTCFWSGEADLTWLSMSPSRELMLLGKGPGQVRGLALGSRAAGTCCHAGDTRKMLSCFQEPSNEMGMVLCQSFTGQICVAGPFCAHFLNDLIRWFWGFISSLPEGEWKLLEVGNLICEAHWGCPGLSTVPGRVLLLKAWWAGGGGWWTGVQSLPPRV